MPKKYRPPAKRRKSKRHTQPNIPTASAVTKQQLGAIGVIPPPMTDSPRPAIATGPDSGHHVHRDYSYVLTDVRYIILIAAFILVSLLGTAAGLRWV